MNKNFIIPQWSAPINIKAIQTTRNGGISLDRYSSLNLSNKVGDNQKHVEDNLKKISNFLPSKPIWLNQVHSNIAQELPTKNNLDCDASFTYEKQIICAVRTADICSGMFAGMHTRRLRHGLKAMKTSASMCPRDISLHICLHSCGCSPHVMSRG